MEEVASKRYGHDHVSAYKGRGDKLGISNRFVRAQRVNEDRKASRIGELTKRRRMPLSSPNEQNESLLETSEMKTTSTKVNGNEKTKEAGDHRKGMLEKWRKQRELKKKAESAQNAKKSTFAVRHIQYEQKFIFGPLKNSISKHTIKSKSAQAKENEAPIKPAKHLTRSSVRLAASKEPQARSRLPSDKKASTSKAVTSKKAAKSKITGVQSERRVTRQMAKSKSSKPTEVTNVQDEKPTPQEKEPKLSVASQADEKTTAYKDIKKQQCQPIAPANFQFTAPSGIESFQYLSKDFRFEPLSPASAEGFFLGTTSSFPSPNNHREVITKENFINNKSIQELCSKDANPIPIEPFSETGNSESISDMCQHNSGYFRNLIVSETARLNEQCEMWEKVLSSEEDLSEEVFGNIRTAVGQAQLLISQRFKQFSGLIDLSEDKTADKKATLSDLQGFWDMIYFQVEDVNTKMKTLEKRQQNNWIEEVKQVRKPGKKTKTKQAAIKGVATKPSKSAGGKSRVQEIRIAMRAKMAQKKRQENASNEENCSFVNILIPVTKNPDGEVVLTPVRRSLRNTPLKRSVPSPVVVTTPNIRQTSPGGLRLTPEILSSPPSTVQQPTETNIPENSLAQTVCQDQEMPDILSTEETSSKTENEDAKAMEGGDNMECNSSGDYGTPLPVRSRSALRSTGRKLRRVSFQSLPKSCPPSSAGGTPGPLIFTPGIQANVTNARSTGAAFIHVAVSFGSPVIDAAGHIPAQLTPQPASASGNWSPVRQSTRKRRVLTPYHQDEVDGIMPVKQTQTPLGDIEGADPRMRSFKRRSARRSKVATPCGEITTAIMAECLLDKYFLPSEEEQSDDNQASGAEIPIGVSLVPMESGLDNSPESSQTEAIEQGSESGRVHLAECDTPPSPLPKTTLFVSPQSPTYCASENLAGKGASDTEDALLSITPLRGNSNKINWLSLTPASGLAALDLNDTPVAMTTRRDSVFFAPSSSQFLDGKSVKDNLMSFSPLPQ